MAGALRRIAIKTAAIGGAARWHRIVLVLAVIVPVGAILFVRIGLGFRFSVPWPDETSNIAQAYALAFRGTLFDPGLDPDRVVMWMPFGYMVWLAAAFRLFGYSFALVRWLSAACVLTSFALWLAVLRPVPRRPARLLLAAAGALAFCSPYVLISSNIGRMDSLLGALALAALLAALHRRPYLAIAALLIGANVHFNAVYFVPGAGVALLLYWMEERRLALRGTDLLALAASLAAVGAYAIVIARNWPGFLADMSLQFIAKHKAEMSDTQHPIAILAAALLLAGATIAMRRRIDRATIAALWGAGFIAMSHFGIEVWYDYGLPVGFLLLAAAPFIDAPRLHPANLSVFAASVALLAYTGYTPGALLRPLLPTWAMLHHDLVPKADLKRLHAAIRHLKPGETVDFGWTGMENFFHNDLAHSGAQWTIVRHSEMQIYPFRHADWRVRCDSSQWPRYMFVYDIGYPRHGEDRGCAIFRP